MGDAGEIDAKFLEECFTAACQANVLVAHGKAARFHQTVEQLDAHFAGQMVVADARLAHRRIARTGARAQVPGACRHAHHLLQHLGDVAIRQPEVAVAALLNG